MTWNESLHPRVPAGKATGGEFTHAAGVEGQGTKQRDLYERVMQPDGGFTYNPITGDEPKDGYAVSIFPERSWATDAKSMTFHQLAEYVSKNGDLLSDMANHLGVWHDPVSRKVFVDVSRVVSSRKEAASLALKHDQIAYYGLREGESFDVNRSATSGGTAS